MAAEEHAGEVRVDHLVPVVDAHVRDAANVPTPALLTRMSRPPNRSTQAAGCCRGFGGIADVGGGGMDPVRAPARRKLLPRSVELRSVAACNHDARTVIEQGLRDRETDSPRSARHERHSAGQRWRVWSHATRIQVLLMSFIAIIGAGPPGGAIAHKIARARPRPRSPADRRRTRGRGREGARHPAVGADRRVQHSTRAGRARLRRRPARPRSSWPIRPEARQSTRANRGWRSCASSRRSRFARQSCLPARPSGS